MKAILISIKPKYVADILNGIKTLEIHKRFPKDYVGWVYIYVTKDKRYFLDQNDEPNDNSWVCWDYTEETFVGEKKNGKCGKLAPDEVASFNGTIIARFWCDKVENIKWHKDTAIDLDYYKVVNVIENKEILKESCLQLKELEDYLQIKNAKNIPTTWGITFNLGYAIHITEVKPFDKPKEIKEFNAYCKKSGMECLHCKHYWTDDSAGYSIPKCSGKPLTRAPESWCYIEL